MTRRTNSKTSSLETHLGYWLRFVSNHVSNSFKAKVLARGVTVAEWVVLRTLFEQEMKPSEVAERAGLTRGTVSKLLDRLTKKELVVVRADRDDHRAQFVTLTAQARKLVPKLAALADANDREVFGHLSERERGSLHSLLRGVAAHHGLKEVPID